MLSRVFFCAVIGHEGVIIEVEVDYSNGLPAVIIVGLLDAAVQKSRERVQTAVKNAGLHFPCHRFVVTLSPAAIRKEGPAYDLPIALGVVILTGASRKILSMMYSLSANFRSMVWSATHAVFYRWRPLPVSMDSSGCSSPKCIPQNSCGSLQPSIRSPTN